MTTPLVSVCIGTFNRKRYIRETLDSVFAQTYPNFEVIVVDDASTDGARDILRSYGDRIRLIERTTNSGICSITRNQAARAANGELIAFLDSDDTWYPEKLQTQVEFLAAHPDIPLCHTYCHLMDEDSKVCGVRHEGALPPTGDCFRKLLRHCLITISSVMMRKKLFEQVGGYFTEDPLYGIWGEEYEFLLRVARRFHIGLVDQILGRYRRGPSGISWGNWKYTPESVPFHRVILERRDIWEGVAPYSEPLRAFVDTCLENCIYWRGKRNMRRSVYFAALALQKDPLNGRVVGQMARSLLKPLLGRA